MTPCKDTDDEEDGAEAAEEGTEWAQPVAVLRRFSFICEPQLDPEVGQTHIKGQESA